MRPGALPFGWWCCVVFVVEGVTRPDIGLSLNGPPKRFRAQYTRMGFARIALERNMAIRSGVVNSLRGPVEGGWGFLIAITKISSHMCVTRKGFTLVEVSVACLMLGIVSVGMAGLLLTAVVVPKMDNARYEAAFAAKKLREHLKSYVTADTGVTLNAPGNPPWHLPFDSSCDDCWALSNGVHDATAMLPEDLKVNCGATMRYVVGRETYAGRQITKVRIAVDWSAP